MLILIMVLNINSKTEFKSNKAKRKTKFIQFITVCLENVKSVMYLEIVWVMRITNKNWNNIFVRECVRKRLVSNTSYCNMSVGWLLNLAIS